MSDYEALHLAWLDNPADGVTAQALADYLEERQVRGDADLAYALRWAAARKRWPKISPKGRSVTWMRIILCRFRTVSVRAKRQPVDHHELPKVLYNAIQPIPQGPECSWRSLDAAYGALARALATLRDAVEIP